MQARHRPSVGVLYERPRAMQGVVGALFALVLGVRGSFNCTDGSLNASTCVLRGESITLDAGSASVVAAGNLVLVDTSITLPASTGAPLSLQVGGSFSANGSSAISAEELELRVAGRLSLSSTRVASSDDTGSVNTKINISATGDVVLSASNLSASSVYVFGSSFSADGQTRVRALAPLVASGQGTAPASSGAGGGMAGTGSQAVGGPTVTGAAFGSPLTSLSFGGCGAGLASGVSGGRGGGVVSVRSTGALSASGTFDASGAAPEQLANASATAGGGAGGTILIEGASVAGTAVFRVMGATGTDGGGSGGGGIVRVNAPGVDPSQSSFRFEVGGAPRNGTGSGLYSGGNGLIYFEQQRWLECNGNKSLAAKYTEWTWIPGLSTPAANLSLNTLRVVGGCFVEAQNPSGNLSIEVRDAFLLSDSSLEIKNTPAAIRSSDFNIIASRYQNTGAKLDISTGSFVVDSSSSFKSGPCTITATSVNIDTSFEVAGGDLAVASGTFQLGAGTLEAARVFVQVDGLGVINGTVRANYRQGTGNCSDPAALGGPVFSLLTNGEIDIGQRATVSGQYIKLEASLVRVSGTVLSDGLGCLPGEGSGAGGSQPSGLPVGSYPTGGGGHAGAGGYGSNGALKTPAGQSYGVLSGNPAEFTLGSGGGHSSGATASSPGSGGGLVWINATNSIVIDGQITSNGAPGGIDNSIAIGGGSGGSVILMSRTLDGGGVVQANGGDGGTGGEGGGGGGGGGFVVFIPFENSSSLGNFQESNARADGGQPGLPGGAGVAGVVSKIPQCSDGYEGIICTPCAIGFYKNTSSMSACGACPNGTYAADAASIMCTPCNPGTFAVQNLGTGTASCSPCQAGYYAAGSGADECDPCSAGEYSPMQSDQCIACNVNTYSQRAGSPTCTACPDGTQSDSRASSCRNCTNPPNGGRFVHGGGCSYDCPSGTVQPQCLQPFTALVRSMGGAVAAACIIMTIAIVFGLPFFIFFWLRRRERMREFEADLRWGSVKSDSGFTSFSNSSYRRSSSITDQTDEKRYERLEDVEGAAASTEPPKSAFQQQRVRAGELNLLMHRIYLHGRNTPARPLLLLPGDAPVHIGVFRDEWTTFRARFNERLAWAEWERRTLIALYWLYYPLALVFLQRQQARKTDAAMRYVMEYDHAFFKNQHLRTMSSSLRFGLSRDGTFGWIDIVASSIAVKDNILSTREFPLVLVCSGAGGFHDPFHLDVEDAFIQSPIKYFGRSWAGCLSHLNTHLRRVRTGNLRLLAPAMEYLSVVQHHGVIGLGACMPIQGVSIAVGIRSDAMGDWRPVVIIDSRKGKARGEPMFAMSPMPVPPEMPSASFSGITSAGFRSDSSAGGAGRGSHSGVKQFSISDSDQYFIEGDGGETPVDGDTPVGEYSGDEDDDIEGEYRKESLLERALGRGAGGSRGGTAKTDRTTAGEAKYVTEVGASAARYPVVLHRDTAVYRSVNEILLPRGSAGAENTHLARLQALFVRIIAHEGLVSRSIVVGAASAVTLLSLFFCLLYVQFALSVLSESSSVAPLLLLPLMPYVAVFSALFGMSTDSAPIIRGSVAFLLVSLLNSLIAIIICIAAASVVGPITEGLAFVQFFLSLIAIVALRFYVVHVDFKRDMRYLSIAITQPQMFGRESMGQNLRREAKQ